MHASRLPIRLARPSEAGIEFVDWLTSRLRENRAARQRMEAFIQEWDHLRDEVRARELREPTLEEYAERWGVAVSTAYRLLDEFRGAVGIDYPSPLCELLWQGMTPMTRGEQIPRPKWLLAVRIIEA